MLKKLREPVNGLTHLFAAVAAAMGLVVLLYVGRDSLFKQVSLFVYASSLVLMFAASAAYHLIRGGPRISLLLRKLDHTSIYLLIAGTYTPICLQFLTGIWQWGILAVIWSMAAIGIIVKMFVIHAPRWITAAVYILMGWLSLFAIPEILRSMPETALIWLVVGGALFTAGAAVYVTERPDWFPGVFGFHELWHIFVILGCISHFIVIAAYVAPGTAM
ncbi:MAG: hemolysin III family protein [Chloroflexi bacterium]|nr:hemolysin III family protein [Chloroflexota bacterium]